VRGFFVPAHWTVTAETAAILNGRFDVVEKSRDTFNPVPAITASKVLLISGPGLIVCNPYDIRDPFEETWFLHTDTPGTLGTRIEYSPNTGMYYMDVGSAGWQARVIADWAVELAKSAMIDGVYWDGPGTPAAYIAAGLGVYYPHYTAATFEAACIAFIKAVKAAIGTKLLILNAACYNPFVAVADGSLYEDFVHACWDANATLQTKAEWLVSVDTIADQDLDDKYILAYAATSETTLLTMQEYAYASFLLGYNADAKAYFYWLAAAEANAAPGNWFDVWEMELGDPLGPYYIWDGLYRRDFASGMVLVNSNDSGDAVTVTLDNNYVDSGGFVVSTMTLANKTGVVLELYEPTESITAICTDEDVKDYLKLTALSLGERRFLARMIDAATNWIEALLSRLVRTRGYTLSVDGNGIDFMYPRDDAGRPLCPITALTSLKIDDVTIDVTDATKVLLYGNAGYIRLVDGTVFTRGYQNIDLGVTAGFTTLPPIVVQACCELVAQKWYLRDKQQQNVATLSEMGTTVTFTKDMMPKETLEALLLYRKLSV
jgi:hypothetical protein